MKLKLIIILSFFHMTSEVSCQALKLNEAYYDSLHQYLITTNLTHYNIYFKNSRVYQWQDPTCDNDTVNTASLMKSITGIAVGELLENGFIESLDDKVCKYIPEWQAGCENNVTIKHLVTMTSGILKKPAKERIKFFTTNDWNSFVFNLELDTIPGSKWAYSNEAGQLLEPIIGRASGMDVQAFFDKFIFQPLDMKHSKLFQDSVGNYSTIGGASTHINDLSHLGLAVLKNGNFNGKQVIDPEFLKAALTPIPQNAYYGFMWWLDKENNTYTAMGDGGSMIIVYPDKELVFVRANNCKTGRDPMRWMGPTFVQKIAAIVGKK